VRTMRFGEGNSPERPERMKIKSGREERGEIQRGDPDSRAINRSPPGERLRGEGCERGSHRPKLRRIVQLARTNFKKKRAIAITRRQNYEKEYLENRRSCTVVEV